MAKEQDFLFEMGTEELPAKSLLRLVTDIREGVIAGLAQHGFSHGAVHYFATPHRLAIYVEQLAAEQAMREVERKGPALAAAFDSAGKPTKACEGFARSCGVTVAELEKLETPQGTWLVHRYKEGGLSASAVLPKVIQQALTALPIAKPMRWNAYEVAFIRPVHWLVALYGKDIVPIELFGLSAGNLSHGHRFHHPDALPIADAKDYAERLKKEAYVISNFEERREKIRAQAEKVAAEKKAHVVIDADLLDEVTGLVEWPVALLAEFPKEFLKIPAEALISAMQVHQKCFPVVDKQGKLLPYFVTISNIESTDPSQVILGNERVMRARLSDAAFFYHHDSEQHLIDQLDKLKTVIFQEKLGSLYDKAERISALAGFVAKKLNADSSQASRAGLLAKIDLLSAMVGEFPELQGIMGYHYARNDGEPEAIARALQEHYLPRFSGDLLPESDLGSALAIADRIDSLVGIFGIQLAPTGDKDPFALRRAAVGVLRIMIEKQLNLDLVELLEQSKQAYGKVLSNKNVVSDVHHFMLERLRASYLEQGVASDVLAAVIARMPSSPFDFHQRVQAVSAFRQLPAATALAAANKRVSNLLSKEGAKTLSGEPDLKQCQEPAEKALMLALTEHAKKVQPLLEKARYTEALTCLASLQAPVDQFFIDVMVMVDDEKLRINRLRLLAALRNLFLQVADISLLQGSGE